jgi:hypothetical protein
VEFKEILSLLTARIAMDGSEFIHMRIATTGDIGRVTRYLSTRLLHPFVVMRIMNDTFRNNSARIPVPWGFTGDTENLRAT